MGVTAEWLHPYNKKEGEHMTYKVFHDMLNQWLTEKEIATIQESAFQNYEDAHGY